MLVQPPSGKLARHLADTHHKHRKMSLVFHVVAAHVCRHKQASRLVPAMQEYEQSPTTYAPSAMHSHTTNGPSCLTLCASRYQALVCTGGAHVHVSADKIQLWSTQSETPHMILIIFHVFHAITGMPNGPRFLMWMSEKLIWYMDTSQLSRCGPKDCLSKGFVVEGICL